MFMPTDVKVNYNMKFTDTSIGSLTALGSQVIGEILRGDMAAAQDKLSQNAKEVAQVVTIDGLVSAMSSIPSLSGAKRGFRISNGSSNYRQNGISI